MPRKPKFMRGKKKKGRVVKPGQETAEAVGAALLNKLQANGLKVDPAAQDPNNSMLDQSAWTYYSESTNVDTQFDQNALNASAADFSLKAELEDFDKKEEQKEEDAAKAGGKERDKTVDVGDINSVETAELKVDIAQAKQNRIEQMIASERAKQLSNQNEEEKKEEEPEKADPVQS